MEVAQLVASLRADLIGFQRNMALADSMLAATRSQVRDTERSVAELAAALNAVKADKAKLFEIVTMFEGVESSADGVRNAALEAARAILGVKMGPGQAAETVAGIEAEAKAMRDLRDASVETRLAQTKVADIDWGNAIRATRLFNMQMDQVAESVVRVNGAIPLGTSQRVFAMPTAALTPSGIPNEDLRRMAIFEEHATGLQREAAAALTGSAGALAGSATALNAAAASGKGGGGGGFGTGLLAGMGFGGGRGIWLPGFGFRGLRIGGGMATLGSLAGLMGFGAERMLASTLGIVGSLGAGVLGGGGLLAAGALGTTAVGMGTDLAGIGQAAGDIKTVSSNLGALQTAIQEYGRNSTQAANAQLALNQSLRGFSPVARGAVMAAVQTSQAFKAMFDKATGQAEKTGAEIINQAMHVGEKFLPTTGKFARQNMQIIQHAIQPSFSWLQQKGPQGGLGIFTNLELIFQRRLPTTVHALSQAAELFAKVIDVAAQHTGGLMQHLDAFFTKWNAASNFGRVSSEVGKLIALFRTWMGLFGSLIHLVFSLFQPAVGLGKQFAQTLTDIVNQVRAWISATGTQNVLHSLFAAHAQQVKELGQLFMALLPLLESVVSAFLQIEAAFAAAFNNGLKPIIDAVKWLLSNPLVDKILGWAGAMWLVVRAAAALKVAFALMFSSNFLAGLKAIPLAFLGIQTAEVRAAVATAAETTAVQAQTIAIGEQAAVSGGLLGFIGRSSIGAGAIAGGAALLSRLGPAALFAGGGFLAGGLAKQTIPGRAGGVTQDALRGAGVGAGLGFLLAPLTGGISVGVGAGLGAGLGALTGSIIGLIRTVPKLSTELNTLGQTFLSLQPGTLAASLAQHKFADKLREVTTQAREASLHVQYAVGPHGSGATMGFDTYAVDSYIARFNKLAASARAIDPELARVYRDIALIAQNTHAKLSPMQIRILLHAESTGNGAKLLARMYGIGPGGGPVGPLGPNPLAVPPGYNAIAAVTTLPAAIALEIAKAQAGHGSIEKADAAAYAYYEHLLKRHDLTRKQILAIYQAEAPYAPYQTPGTYQHATGTKMLPAGLAAALAQAQQRAAATTGTSVSQQTAQQAQRALSAERALLQEQQRALAALQAEHATGQKLVALKKEELALTRQIAATERSISAEIKRQHDLQAQAKINKVLGIGSGVHLSQAEAINQRERTIFIRALEHLLGGSRHNIAVTAKALGVTVGQLTRESPAQLLRQMRQHGITLDSRSLGELRKIQEAIRIAHAENVKLTPAETRKITNWLQQIDQQLSGASTIASNYIAPSARALVSGLGLTRKQRDAEIARLSSYYLHGHRVPTGGAAGGVPLPPGVGGGVQLPIHHRHRHRLGGHMEGGGSMMSVGQVVINLDAAGKDGAALAREIRAELLRIQRRNGAQTRGPNAGRGVGLG